MTQLHHHHQPPHQPPTMRAATSPPPQPPAQSIWSPGDTVKDVAESLGVNNMSDEAAKSLAMDVEYRIHQVLEQAIKFMRHSKRSNLSTLDISEALGVLNVEPLYGYDFANAPLSFREAGSSSSNNNQQQQQQLYYIDDEEVDFEKIINMPLPNVPHQVSLSAHWLAVEGVQPSIPQNPTIQQVKKDMSSSLIGSDKNHSLIANVGNNNLQVKPLVKHVLSKELQLYFDQIISILTDESDLPIKSAALASLRQDPGLHQLVPYFIQFISDKITHNLSNTNLLYTMLDMIDALLNNKSIFIDLYIHSIIPPILTLLLGKNINSYELRDYASSLLSFIHKNFYQHNDTLKPRLTRTLLYAFLDITLPPSTHYGALIGLNSMGNQIIRVLVLPNLSNWVPTVLNQLQPDSVDYKRLLDTLVDIVSHLNDENNNLKTIFNQDPRQSFTDLVSKPIADAIYNKFPLDEANSIANSVVSVQNI